MLLKAAKSFKLGEDFIRAGELYENSEYYFEAGNCYDLAGQWKEALRLFVRFLDSAVSREQRLKHSAHTGSTGSAKSGVADQIKELKRHVSKALNRAFAICVRHPDLELMMKLLKHLPAERRNDEVN